MGTVHQFSVQGKPATGEPEEAFARALRRAVDATVGAAASFQEREVAALALSNEATRLFLQDDRIPNKVHKLEQLVVVISNDPSH